MVRRQPHDMASVGQETHLLADNLPVSLHGCAKLGGGRCGLSIASASARLSAALSRIISISSTVRTAASCALAITKSVSVRPWSSAARLTNAFCSLEIRA